MGGVAPVESRDERALLRQPLGLPRESLAFVLFSLCDLIVTALVFRCGGYEANVLAAYFLRYYGIRGLTLYKFTLTGGIVVACQVIWHKYPRLARFILLGGCAVYGCVVVFTIIRLHHHLGYFPLP